MFIFNELMSGLKNPSHHSKASTNTQELELEMILICLPLSRSCVYTCVHVCREKVKPSFADPSAAILKLSHHTSKFIPHYTSHTTLPCWFHP